VDLLDIFGVIGSLYLGYVNDFLSLGTYSSALPWVMNFFRVSGIHQKNIILPKSSLSVQTYENKESQTFWQRILLTITDSWFFDWLEKYIKNEKKTALPDEKILVQKNLSKSRYSRVI
jgi:hypothetical protein